MDNDNASIEAAARAAVKIIDMIPHGRDPSDPLDRKFIDAAIDSTASIIAAEFAGMAETLSKLPRTADGVPVVPGMRLYPPCGHDADDTMGTEEAFGGSACIHCYGMGCKSQPYYGENDYYEPGEPREFPYERCYSTREAAAAALSATHENKEADHV